MKQIMFPFFYTFTLMVCLPPLLPDLRVLFFAPFLVYSFYHQTKEGSLWLALLCGLIIDLLSAHTRLGFYALNYCLTTNLLYRQKKHFFADNLSTLPIMAFIFSALSTLIQAILLYAFGQGMILSLDWIAIDLIWLPMLDALYAGIAFTLPSLLRGYRYKARQMTH